MNVNLKKLTIIQKEELNDCVYGKLLWQAMNRSISTCQQTEDDLRYNLQYQRSGISLGMRRFHAGGCAVTQAAGL